LNILALLGGLVLLPVWQAQAQTQTPQISIPRGPDGIADVIDEVIDSVVLISTSQDVGTGSGDEKQAPPDLSEEVPLDQFFDDFFKRQQQGENQQRTVG